jgi:hypothetical protein
MISGGLCGSQQECREEEGRPTRTGWIILAIIIHVASTAHLDMCFYSEYEGRESKKREEKERKEGRKKRGKEGRRPVLGRGIFSF